MTTTVPSQPIDLSSAEVRFSTKRWSFHAPRGYRLFSSATGFAEANALYVSADGNPLELRIVAFGARFDERNTSVTAFKLTQAAAGPSLPAPSNFTSTASTSQTAINWDPVTGATEYEVTRRANGATEQIIATTASPGTNATVTAGTAYLYRVRAVGANGASPFTPSTVAAVRTLAAIAPVSFAPTLTVIRAQDVNDLSTAPTQALNVLSLPSLTRPRCSSCAMR